MGLAGGDHTKETDSDCNVCGSSVEIVNHAASQCSNHNCLTRERDNNLSTDATDEELAAYWKERAHEAESQCALTEGDVLAHAQDAFKDYINAESRADAEEAEIRADVYLDHTDKGWGWLKEESDV